MASAEESTSCNREPFLSGDGCDRGNVDIHQFDDLPYCDPIDPTQADIPPEIVDTPINVPIPPACSCININMKAGIGYGDGFRAGTSFKSVGDCCDGNYESNISLDIPCPIPFRGDRTITASVAYSDSPSPQTKPFIHGELCNVNAFNVDLPLAVPCPINTPMAQITVGIGYGEGNRKQTRRYLDNKTGRDCSLNALNPEFDLNIPCPVVGAKKGEITVGIGYGDGESRRKAQFIKADSSPQGCSVEALSPEIDLNIPCPITSSGSIKIGAKFATACSQPEYARKLLKDMRGYVAWLGDRGYSNEYRGAASIYNACQSLPDVLDNLCPPQCECGDEKCKEDLIDEILAAQRNISVARSQNLAICDVNLATRQVCSSAETLEGLANSALEEFYNDGKPVISGVSASLWAPSPDGCGIDPTNPDMTIPVPCPIERPNQCMEDPEHPEKGPTDVRLKFKKELEEGDTKTTLVDLDSKECIVRHAEEVEITAECPLKKLEGKTTKVSIGYKNDAAPKQMDLVDIDDENCTVKPMEEVNLDIPCPPIKVEPGTIMPPAYANNVKVREVPGQGGCEKTFKLDITFPDGGGGGGGGGDECQVSGISLDFSLGGITCTLKRDGCDDIKGVVTGLKMEQIQVVTEVKLENNTFKMQKRNAIVFSPGEPAWTEVFYTTPICGS